MQDISGLPEEGQQLINGYADGGFRVSGQRYEGNILIFTDATKAWDIEDINALTTDHLKDVLEADPKVEILLIGCGENMAFIDEGLRNTFRANGTTIDSMDTGAAVRTYNVLLLEGRRVAVALIAV